MQQRVNKKTTEAKQEHNSQSNVQIQKQAEESSNAQTYDYNPLENVTCRIGDNACAAKHVSAIQRTELFKPMNESQRVQSLLRLQQQYGNRFVQRVIAQHVLQTKLTIGQPGDIYEQEADRVAEQVMQTSEPQVQRQPLEEEEEELQAKPLSGQITPLVQKQPIEEEELQMQPIEEEEEELQAKEILNATRGNSQPLPAPTRAFFESRFGYDFRQVQVHTGAEADTLNHALNARSFTIGRDIFFRQGEYNPGSSNGRKLLAHELTHVVQQNGDRVQRKPAMGQTNDRFGQETNRLPRAIIPAVNVVTDNPPSVTTGIGRRIQKARNRGTDGSQYVELAIPDGTYVLEVANIPASIDWGLEYGSFLTIYGTASQYNPRHIYGLNACPHLLRNTNTGVRRTGFRIRPGREMEPTAGQGSAKVQAFRHNRILADEPMLEAYLRFDTAPLIHSVTGRTTQVATSAVDMTPGRQIYKNVARGAEAVREETVTMNVSEGYTLSTQREITNTIGSEITSQIGVEGVIQAQIGSSISAETSVRRAIGRQLTAQLQRSRQLRESYKLTGVGQYALVPTCQVWQTSVVAHTYNENTGRVTGRMNRFLYTVRYNPGLSIYRVSPSGQIDFSSVVSREGSPGTTPPREGE